MLPDQVFPSLDHLRAHHGDFASFREVMLQTAPGRFGSLWWGAWEQLVNPAPDATVIDLGCGAGSLLTGLRAHVPNGRLIGVEIQPAMLEHAYARAAEVGGEIVEADLAGPIPLPDGVADVITLVHVFHEVPYPVPLLGEVARLLRPGGMLVLYDWVRYPLELYLQGEEPTAERMASFREHCAFAVEDLAFLVRRAGFTVREIVGRREGRYALVVAERA